jgi:hypothetical protein
MAHTYMVFEFPNEEKAQQARHKLEGWKQAFRADKKVQVKFDRGDEASAETEASTEPEPEHEEKKAAKAKSHSKDAKTAKSKKSEKSDDEAANSGPVKLLVRLYFSGHEKITEKQWFDRIPTDEIFKVSHPHIIHEKDAAFGDTNKKFDSLE